jgi:hypothetical protein
LGKRGTSRLQKFRKTWDFRLVNRIDEVIAQRAHHGRRKGLLIEVRKGIWLELQSSPSEAANEQQQNECAIESLSYLHVFSE